MLSDQFNYQFQFTQDFLNAQENNLELLYNLYFESFEDIDMETFKFQLSECQHILTIHNSTSNKLEGFSLTGFKTLLKDKICFLFNGPTCQSSSIRKQGIFAYFLQGYAIRLRKEIEKQGDSGYQFYYFMMSEAIRSYLFCFNLFGNSFYPNPWNPTPSRCYNLLKVIGRYLGQTEWIEDKDLIIYEEGEGKLRSEVAAREIKDSAKPRNSESLQKTYEQMFRFYDNLKEGYPDSYLCCIAQLNSRFFCRSEKELLIPLFDMSFQQSILPINSSL